MKHTTKTTTLTVLLLFALSINTTGQTTSKSTPQTVVLTYEALLSLQAGVETPINILTQNNSGEMIEITEWITLSESELPCPNKAAMNSNDTAKKENAESRISQIHSISPNPTNGRFDLNYFLAEAQDIQIRLLDPSGKEVHTQTASALSGEAQAFFDLQGLAKGVYVLQLILQDQVLSEKIVFE